MTLHKVLQPKGWPRASGYSNGIAASGRMVFTAGIIGWDEHERFPASDFPGQFRQILVNTLAVLAEGGARPEHIVRMTWYVISRADYLRHAREVGTIYRELLGRNFPAMAVMEVSALMEPKAKLEIETTAVVPLP